MYLGDLIRYIEITKAASGHAYFIASANQHEKFGYGTSIVYAKKHVLSNNNDDYLNLLSIRNDNNVSYDILRWDQFYHGNSNAVRAAAFQIQSALIESTDNNVSMVIFDIDLSLPYADTEKETIFNCLLNPHSQKFVLFDSIGPCKMLRKNFREDFPSISIWEIDVIDSKEGKSNKDIIINKLVTP